MNSLLKQAKNQLNWFWHSSATTRTKHKPCPERGTVFCMERVLLFLEKTESFVKDEFHGF
ncbi:hypothetical protein, partial [Jeotgalibaca porci]|uniref:hypothetical protein n=1 Tax=Jeotgalibaca porci TaxID=1868793 RepID=UPI0035A06C31